jgi:hypothetical protein
MIVVDDDQAEKVSTRKWYWDDTKDSAVSTTDHVYLHVFLFGRAPLGYEWDHASGDRGDNRRENLRLAIRSQNMMNNQKPVGHHTSKFKGVYWNKALKKWHARIPVERKRVHLGFFDDETEAAKAYDRAATEHHGEFARLNFPVQKEKR